MVLEEKTELVDWGFKAVKGEKNAGCVKEVEKMLTMFLPDMVALENTTAKESRRHLRVQQLTAQLVAAAKARKIRVKLLSRAQVREYFFGDRRGNKHEMAQMLGARFPDELGTRVPSKREPWESEDSRMDIFEAGGLALAAQSEAQE